MELPHERAKRIAENPDAASDSDKLRSIADLLGVLSERDGVDGTELEDFLYDVANRLENPTTLAIEVIKAMLDGDEGDEVSGSDNSSEGDNNDEGDATDSKSDSKQGDRGNSEQQSPTRQHIDDNSWDKHDFDKVADMPAEEKSQLAADVKEAIAQGEILATRAGGKSPRSHGAMLTREIPWHEIFRDFVKANMSAGDDLTTWRQYKRSMIGQGIYMPSTYSEKMRRMVVARDTSGSIGDQVLNLFNGYLVSVCQEVQPEELIVLDWGSAVVNDERYNSVEGYDSIMYRTKMVGGGGTSPEVIGAYLNKHNIEADCIVVLTDGCFCSYSFADFGIPTLWCVLEYYWEGFTRPFGQAVKIKA